LKHLNHLSPCLFFFITVPPESRGFLLNPLKKSAVWPKICPEPAYRATVQKKDLISAHYALAARLWCGDGEKHTFFCEAWVGEVQLIIAYCL